MLVYKLKTCQFNSRTNEPIAVSHREIQDSKGGKKETSLSQKTEIIKWNPLYHITFHSLLISFLYCVLVARIEKHLNI